MIWIGFAFSRFLFCCFFIQPDLLMNGGGILKMKPFRVLLPTYYNLSISGTCRCFSFYPGLRPGSPCLCVLKGFLQRKESSGFSSHWFLAWQLWFLLKYKLKDFSGGNLMVYISVFTLKHSTGHIPKGI